MKNNSILITIISLLIFSGCKKEETIPPAFEIPGSWRVSYYHIGAVDHTNDFAGYSFVFNNDSKIVATINSVNETGTWVYNSTTLQFDMTIGSSSPLITLSKVWIFVLKSETELIFDEDNSLNDEELHFYKN